MAHASKLLLALSLALTACDSDSREPAADGTEGAEAVASAPAVEAGSSFGDTFTLSEAQPVDVVLAEPAAFVDKTVRLEGTVVDVCEMRGCWLTLGAQNGDALRVKVRDGEMVFPMSARGLTAQVEGTITSHTISVEDQIKRGEYFAKENGETFDPASVTGPKTIYMLAPTSVQIAS